MALPLYVLLRASSLSSLMPAQCHDALLHLSNEQSSCLALELERKWLRIYVCTDETHNKNNDDNDERQMKIMIMIIIIIIIMMKLIAKMTIMIKMLMIAMVIVMSVFLQ